MAAPVIPLVQVSRAFDVFAGYVQTGIPDFEGRVIETDFGDYTHAILNEERIRRVTWIAPTASEPDEVWLWHSKKPKKRQLGIRQRTYVKWIRSAADQPPELFVLGTEILPTGQLRLRTWYTPNNPETELKKLSKGERLWPPRM